MLPVRDTIPVRHPAVALWLLIGLTSAVFLLEVSLAPDAVAALVRSFGVVPLRFLGDPAPLWTLVTCMFLHGGWLHLLGNLWTLWIFGDNVEDRMGPGRFALFYVVCGVVAAAAEVVMNPTSTAPMVGASGAIAGVMGAYFAMFPRARIVVLVPLLLWPLYFEVSAFFYLAYWFGFQVLGGGVGSFGAGASDQVAYWAHIGGFAAGLALHRMFLRAGDVPWPSDAVGDESI